MYFRVIAFKLFQPNCSSHICLQTSSLVINSRTTQPNGLGEPHQRETKFEPFLLLSRNEIASTKVGIWRQFHGLIRLAFCETFAPRFALRRTIEIK